jgi:hypothetical protein
MMSKAHIMHHTTGRIRFRIPAYRGDASFFADLGEQLKTGLNYRKVTVSALTGSVTIEDESLQLDALTRYVDQHGLFTLTSMRPKRLPVGTRLRRSFRTMDGTLKESTDGALDLPSAIFFLLLAFGLTELAMGDFRRPPWYTAFWYAFGLFSKSLLGDIDGDVAGE